MRLNLNTIGLLTAPLCGQNQMAIHGIDCSIKFIDVNSLTIESSLYSDTAFLLLR